MYYLTKVDDVIQSDFWVIPKITTPYLCKPIHHINYFTSIRPSVFGKCGKDGKKLQNWVSQERKELFGWSKKLFFTVFEGL